MHFWRNDNILTYHQTKPGILECTLNLPDLYPTEDELNKFKSRWPQFLDSDPYNRMIYRLTGNQLVYLSEQLIPQKKDRRPSVLMVFGNPASQSVEKGMFFFCEGKEKEHRFWKHIMSPAKIFDPTFTADLSLKQRNDLRKKYILNLNYDSKFRIGLCVFISFPNAASGPWAGIGGVRKLFGAGAMKLLETCEQKRLLKLAKHFLDNKGAAVTFQKNAWEGLRSASDPKYCIDLAKKGRLNGNLNGIRNIPLFGVPPTRLVGPCRNALQKILTKLS